MEAFLTQVGRRTCFFHLKMKYGDDVLWKVCEKRVGVIYVGICSNVQMWRLCKTIKLSQDKSPFNVLNWDKVFQELE